jgi:hypothetical protein
MRSSVVGDRTDGLLVRSNDAKNRFSGNAEKSHDVSAPPSTAEEAFASCRE